MFVEYFNEKQPILLGKIYDQVRQLRAILDRNAETLKTIFI